RLVAVSGYSRFRGRGCKLAHSKRQPWIAVACSEPYTHLIGLGDFAPEGRRKFSPGQAKRSPGFAGLGPRALKGRRSIEGQRPAPLRGAFVYLRKPGAALRLPPANFLRPFRARGGVTIRSGSIAK